MAPGESRTITRHVTFFKKLSSEFEVTVSRSVPLTPPPTPQQPLEDLLPPVQQENGRESLAFRASSPETPKVIPHDTRSGRATEPASQDSEVVGEEGIEQTCVGTQRQNEGKGGGPHLQARQ